MDGATVETETACQQTSIDYDQLVGSTSSQARDLLSKTVGGLDLAIISHVKDYVEQVVRILKDPSSKLDAWDNIGSESSLKANTIRKELQASNVDLPKVRDVKTIRAKKNEMQKVIVKDVGENLLEPPPNLSDLLQTSVEYVALFKVNRPIQSDASCIGDIHKTENIYSDLLEDIQDTVQEFLASRKVKPFKRAHLRELEIVKGAYRSKTQDILSKLNHDAELDLAASIKRLEEEQAQKIKSIEKEIFQCKKDTYQRAHEISKLRSHVSRYQTLLRKNGVQETEDYLVVDEERVRAEDVMEHYQNALAGRQAKIRELMNQLSDIQDIIDAPNWKMRHRVSNDLDANSRRTSAAISTRNQRDGSLMSVESEVGNGFSKKSAKSISNPKHSPPSRGNRQDVNKSESEELSASRALKSPISPNYEDLNAMMGQGELTEEEAAEISNQIREAYEIKLRTSLEEHANAIEMERAEIFRINREFRARYEELTNDIRQDEIISTKLNSKQKPMMDIVQKLFPKDSTRGIASIGIQCDRDTPE